jgi:exosome complex component RRP40
VAWAHPPPAGHLNPFYHPAKGDVVIGIVERRANEDWQVDIGHSHSAILPQLAFAGATKKNCPKFARGDAVAAYVEEVPAAGEALLSCIPRARRAEALGQLAGGTLLRARPADVERLERGGCLARSAARGIGLRVAWGRNGRAFVDAGNAVVSVRVVHALLQALAGEREFAEVLAAIDPSELAVK